MQPPPTGSTIQFEFECDWVDDCEHFSIHVDDLAFRYSMYYWSLVMDHDIDKKGNILQKDRWIISAHEFGHFLGLTDGYIRDGELPWLHDLIGLPKSEDIPWYAPLLTNLFSNEERAKDRASRKCATFDLMITSKIKVSGSSQPNPKIPVHLIDIINAVKSNEEHKTQSLCWHENFF